MIVDEKDIAIINKASDITFTDYEITKNYIAKDNVIAMIEDLICEIDHLKEKYEDLEQDLQDNYKPISHWEYYGISESDFH